MAAVKFVNRHFWHEPTYSIVAVSVATLRLLDAFLADTIIFSCNPPHPRNTVSGRNHLEGAIHFPKVEILCKAINAHSYALRRSPEVLSCSFQLKMQLTITAIFRNRQPPHANASKHLPGRHLIRYDHPQSEHHASLTKL